VTKESHVLIVTCRTRQTITKFKDLSLVAKTTTANSTKLAKVSPLNQRSFVFNHNPEYINRPPAAVAYWISWQNIMGGCPPNLLALGYNCGWLGLRRRLHSVILSYLRRRRQKVMEHFSDLKKSIRKRPISQQNLLINICETYDLDLQSKYHFNLLFDRIC
jgi:hypothetical protein